MHSDESGKNETCLLLKQNKKKKYIYIGQMKNYEIIKLGEYYITKNNKDNCSISISYQ